MLEDIDHYVFIAAPVNGAYHGINYDSYECFWYTPGTAYNLSTLLIVIGLTGIYPGI